MADQRTESNNTINLFTYIQVLWSWKYFIIACTVFILVVSAIFLFSLPNRFTAVASILPPKQEGGLGSTISQITKGILPSGLLNGIGESAGAYNYLAILESRSAMEEVCKRNDLVQKYHVSTRSLAVAVKLLRLNSEFSIEKNGNITIAVTDVNPRLAAKMANDFVDVLNELSIDLSTKEAKNNRLFVEQRYIKAKTDLRNAEDSLQAFQEKYGVISLPEQTKAAIQVLADLQGQLTASEIQSGIYTETLGSDAPEAKLQQIESQKIKDKIRSMLNSREHTSALSSDALLPSLKELPDLGIQYIRLYRDFEIQNKILEFVLPLYEQAKIEEQKTTPVVLVLDRAIPPERKSSPVRSLILLAIMMVCGMVFSLVAFFFEFVGSGNPSNTDIENKFHRLSNTLKRIFRVRTSLPTA